MKKTFFLLICISLLFPEFVFCLDVPKELADDVTEAMLNGENLYDVYLKGPVKEYGILELVDKAKDKIEDFCDFEYKAYTIDSEEGHIIYFIAEPPSQDQIAFGRHYKLIKDTIIPSTKTCFVSSSEAAVENVAAAFTTHLLTETPTEFHVFLSLYHQRPIYVVTSGGVWKVELGKIEYIKKQINE